MGVGPHLEIPEGPRRRLAPAEHHASGFLPPAVVLFVGEPPQLLVALAIPGTERRRESRGLTAGPEVFLENLTLVGLGQLEEDLLLRREDDRRDVLLQPLSLVLWKDPGIHRDAPRLRGLGQGDGGREDEERERSRLHRTVDLNPRSRRGHSLKKVFRSESSGAII